MRPRIGRLNIWKRHEEQVYKSLQMALSLLRDAKPDHLDEVSLNRELFFFWVVAIRKLKFNFVPFPEACNPPDVDDRRRSVREGKRPDFQTGFIDHAELDLKRSAKYLSVECKRLGTAPRPDWHLNRNYIGNGIRRFVLKEYGYGKSAPSGVMVGYIQSMDPNQIQNEISSYCIESHLNEFTKAKGLLRRDRLILLSQQLDRDFPISPFTLNHFWIDLRFPK